MHYETAAPSLRVYVAYHDARAHAPRDQDLYVPVCTIGRHGFRPAGFDHYDDLGWPDRNDRYCELSVLRLAERDDAAVIGLCHYRRVFTTKGGRRRFAPDSFVQGRWDWTQPARHGATAADLLRALGDRDWCTAPPYDVRWSGDSNLWQHYCRYHPEEHLRVLARVLREQHAEMPDPIEWLRGEVRLTPYNMFIARSEHVRAYTSWLWPLLQACEEEIGVPEDTYQRRYAGFLAERLHAYWLASKAQEGLITGHVPIALLLKDGITGAGAEAANGAPALPDAMATPSSNLVQRFPWSWRVAVNRSRRAIRL